MYHQVYKELRIPLTNIRCVEIGDIILYLAFLKIVLTTKSTPHYRCDLLIIVSPEGWRHWPKHVNQQKCVNEVTNRNYNVE